ncbi:CNT_collapsed_G0015750.mRNA.1.CDS.1 [Saccharomyces cerevisiae]|nr:CNT_collapsed_G0015750.mRNA.1.CDS.1 [Saccharomyces cerevisiae]
MHRLSNGQKRRVQLAMGAVETSREFYYLMRSPWISMLLPEQDFWSKIVDNLDYQKDVEFSEVVNAKVNGQVALENDTISCCY